MPDDAFLFDLYECHKSDEQPYDIKSVEPHTAYFSSSSVRRHVPGSKHDKKYGH
ncbi:hypothetical protein D3C74_487640 [compost metagenome]